MMKKFGKIFLIMAVVVVMMLAMMAVASAASLTEQGVSTSIAADAARTITVTVKYDTFEAAQQSTILVVKSGTELTGLEDSAIKYIDQVTAPDGTATYTFKLLENDRQGVYDIWIGGTALDHPVKTSASFDTRKIKGTVVVLGDATKATAVATPATSGAAINGTVAADGTYAIEANQGDYKVVLGKKGYLYKTYDKVTVGAEDVDLGKITLIGGDYNGDSMIDFSDAQAITLQYGQAATDKDINDDGKVDFTDVQNALVNFGTKAADYQ